METPRYVRPTGVLSAGITVKVEWDKPGDQWHATARANVSSPLVDGYTTYGSADDPATAAGMAVVALVKRARPPADLDRVSVNEDTVDRLARAVADRVAEKLAPVALTRSEAVEPTARPKPKNGRRRRRRTRRDNRKFSRKARRAPYITEADRRRS
jgi:hypothetical protein